MVVVIIVVVNIEEMKVSYAQLRTVKEVSPAENISEKKKQHHRLTSQIQFLRNGSSVITLVAQRIRPFLR